MRENSLRHRYKMYTHLECAAKAAVRAGRTLEHFVTSARVEMEYQLVRHFRERSRGWFKRSKRRGQR